LSASHTADDALAQQAPQIITHAQVKFTEWTSDDQLRQPVFLGLRADKPATDVVRE
jgi:ATP-dependent DNA ligase